MAMSWTQRPRREADRDIVSAFAAALAFWSRIDVYGYVTTTNGMFAAEVWPPVAMPPQMATTVAVSALPAGSTLTRLSAEQIQALGLLTHPGRRCRQGTGR